MTTFPTYALTTEGRAAILSQNPVIEVFMQTDQGITGYHTLEAKWLSGSNTGGPNQVLTDSQDTSFFTT